ncbi:hypothetical protein [Schlesneria paludicola]|uniref:hypothetical protein n=1 Tax=Schlesneria paludicola TaxID=360056 RepID=UPI000299FDD4|nr:hypothetical protein [Schlesneria paludicola]
MTAATNPGKYVDFDEYVGLKLEKTRSTIRTTDILTAVAGVGAMTLGYLLLFVVMDQWVIPGGFSAGWRLALLSMLVISAGGWLVYKVGIPSFRSVNGLFAAKAIEKAEPELKSSLLNLVDLKAAGRPINPAILQAIERQTAVKLQQVDVASVIDHRPLVRTAYLLLAVIVIFCIYAMLSPKKISNSIWRGLVPLTQVPLATVTEILDIKPGDISVPVHQPFVDVQVDLAGEIPPQVLLLYSTADGKQDQPLELRADEDGQPRYRGQLIGDGGQGLVQDITYLIRAGDATSKPYRIHVEQPPYADIESLRIEFPAYMKLSPVEQPHHGAIDTWEGATVTFHAKTNMPVRSGTIQFLDDPQAGPNGEEIPMAVSSGGKILQAQWTLALRSDGTFPKHYRIHCKTEEDRVTTGHVNYPITIRPDAPPQVTLVQPDRDIDAPANVTIPLLIQAHDPDFELGYVYLNVEKSGQRILHEQISEGRVQRLTLKHNLELKRLQAAAGDTFELWIEVHDNRRPRANSRNTPKVKIRVIQTVTQQEADEQLAAQNERLDQKMAEASDDANDAANPPREGEPEDRPPRDPTRPDEATARRENQDEQPAQEPQNGQQEDAGQKKPTEPGKTAEKGDSRDGSGQTAGTKPSKKDTAGKPDEARSDQNSGEANDKKLPNDGTQDDEIIRRINERLKQEKPPKSDANPDAAANEQKESQPKPGTPNPDTKPESEKPSKSDKSGASSDEKSSKSDAKSPRKNDRPQGDDAGPTSSDDPSSTKPSESKKDSDLKTSPNKPATAEEPPGDNKKEENPSKMKGPEKDSDGSTDDKTDDTPSDGKKPGSEAAKEGDGTDKPENKPTKSEPTPKGTEPDPASNATDDSLKPSKSESPDDGSKQDGKKPDGGQKDQGNPSEKPTDADQEKGPGEMKTSDDDSQKKSAESSKPSGAGEKKSDKEKSDDAAEQTDKASGSKSDSKKEGEPPKDADESSADSSSASKPGKKPSDSTKKPQKKPSGGEAAPEKGDPETATQQQKQDKNGKPSSTKPNEKANQGKSGKSPDENPSGVEQDPSTDAPKQGKNPKSTKSTENEANEKEPTSNDKDQTPSKSKSDSGEGGDSKKSSGQSGQEGQEGGKQGEGDPQGSKSEGDDTKSSSKSGKEQGGEGSGKPEDSSKNSDSDKSKNDKSSSKADSKQGDSKAPKEGKTGKQDSESGKADSQSQGKKDSGKSDSGKGKNGESGKGESGKGQGDQGGKSEGSSKAGSGSQPGQGGKGPPQDGPGGGDPGDADGIPNAGDAAPAIGEGDDANLEYNRQATELILQKLKKDLERGDVDPELLEQLGWTPAELKKFADRLSKSLNESKQGEETPESRARQQQFQEMLKNLDLQRSGAQRSGANEPKREVNQIESKRPPAPSAYLKAFEKATKDLARQKPPAGKPASK